MPDPLQDMTPKKEPFYWRWVEVIAVISGGALALRAVVAIIDGDETGYFDVVLGVTVAALGAGAWITKAGKLK